MGGDKGYARGPVSLGYRESRTVLQSVRLTFFSAALEACQNCERASSQSNAPPK